MRQLRVPDKVLSVLLASVVFERIIKVACVVCQRVVLEGVNLARAQSDLSKVDHKKSYSEK